MEEASVAGESPDRSKQRESSAEPTSGSAGSVPEARDPRLTVSREKDSSAAVDTATKILSVRDAKRAADSEKSGAGTPGEGQDPDLREAVSAWIRSAEDPQAQAGSKGARDAKGEDASRTDGGTEPGAAADADADATVDAAPATPDADAESDAGTRPGAGSGATAAAGAGTKAGGSGTGSGTASQGGGASSPGADGDAATGAKSDADDATSRSDADSGTKGSGTAGAGTGAKAAGSATDSGASSPGADGDAGTGAKSDADNATSRSDANSGTKGSGTAGAGTGAKPAGSATGSGTSSPGAGASSPGADGDADAKVDAGTGDASEATADSGAKAATAATAAKGTGAASADADTDADTDAGADDDASKATAESAPEAATAATAAKGTGAASADADTDADAKSGADAGRSAGEDAKAGAGAKGAEGAGTAAVNADGDAGTGSKAAGAKAAEAVAGADAESSADTGRDAGREAGADAKAAKVAGAKAAAAAARAAKAAAEPQDAPQGSSAAGDASGAKASPAEAGAGVKGVDQPTTAFKSVRPKKPEVDQPTTMLKLGTAKPKPEGGAKAPAGPAAPDAERASKFVPLRNPDLTAPTSAFPQVGPERTTQQPLPPKPPLDLLAELTNTPPPPETPVRTLVRRVKIWTPLVILLAIVFAVVQAMRPLPQPTLDLTAKDTYTFDGGRTAIPWPAQGQAALDVQGIGTFGSSGAQKPVPIASVAKVMTAYLILRDHPLKSGADGPKIKIDQAAQDQSKAGQESTVDVTAGDSISQREALESILIASANNVARLLARWDVGSEKAFVTKMNATAKSLGMTNTTYTDPSGLTNSTVSTAVDQVKLAKAAMQEPAFREVAAMMSYDDYKGVNHSNWNHLVGHNNVVGIKTGTTTSALGNLVFAAKQEVGGETRTIVGAVVRQPAGGSDNTILSGALDAADKLIRSAQGALKSATVLKKGDVVGYVDDGLGGRTPVVATKDVAAAGWSGLKVKLSFTSDVVPHTAKAGTKVGSLTVGDGGAGAVKVPVALQKDLAEPGLTDKLTRLG
ncbi:D-alanyl-D-alanine carboxypeptidase [Streptomyces sp. DSM 118148]|uniref:D-alanyl-D-alanine carboxypeptidase n=1 Tax=Streptomyces sp. DSM 118148 TaxID=3448667 RepID=UPI00403FF023